MKLTDPEIYRIQEALRDVHGNIDRHEFARAIEAAALAAHPPAAPATWISEATRDLLAVGNNVVQTYPIEVSQHRHAKFTVPLFAHPPAQDRVRPDVYAAAACYARCIISMVGDLGKRQDAEVLAKIQDAVVHAIETFYPPAQDTQDAKDDEDAEYELIQNDELVASAAGFGAFAEIMHYAQQYAEDGPVEIYKLTRQKLVARKP